MLSWLCRDDTREPYRSVTPQKGCLRYPKQIELCPVTDRITGKAGCNEPISGNYTAAVPLGSAGIGKTYYQRLPLVMNTRSHPLDERKVAKRLKNIISVNQFFAEIESLEELFPRMLELAKHVTEFEAASLFMYNPEKDILEFASIADDILSPEDIKR